MNSRRANLLIAALVFSGLVAVCALSALLGVLAEAWGGHGRLAGSEHALLAAGGWALVLLGAVLMLESLWRARLGGPVESLLKPALISSAVLTVVGTSLALGGTF